MPAGSFRSPRWWRISPGFPEGINGPDLVENMRKQAEHFGAEYMHGGVVEADLSGRPFRLSIEGEWVEARTVIIASGASARWLGLPSEQKLIGHGVSSCATCDGFFYRGKKIMVVGGGDSAMEEANFLTRFGSEVSVVHRRDHFRASKIMLDRARHNPKIKFLTNMVVDEIYDVEKGIVTGVKLRNLLTGQACEMDVDGFFVAIGHIPNTGGIQRPDRNGRRRLHRLHGRRQDQRAGRIPCRRRAGPRVQAGHHRRGRGLHGGHRSRAISGSGRSLEETS